MPLTAVSGRFDGRRKLSGRVESIGLSAKHAKTILQAGDARSQGWATVFGYPGEIVPLANPYDRKAGDPLDVRCLVGGKPLAGYRVFAGGRQGTGNTRLAVQNPITDANGVVRIRLTAEGRWYVKFVHMDAIAEPGTDCESRWATLTFAVHHRP